MGDAAGAAVNAAAGLDGLKPPPNENAAGAAGAAGALLPRTDGVPNENDDEATGLLV